MGHSAVVRPDPRTIATYKVALLDERGVGELVEHALELPTLPIIATRVLGAIDDPNRGARDIARLVEGDPGLATRLLRIANSSFYHCPREVLTVQQAVATIGLTEVRNLVLAMATRALYSGPLDGPARRLWQHAVATAAAAHVVATRYAPVARNMAFIAGQIHDIGRVVMLRHDPEAFAHAEQAAPELGLLAAERATFGFTHTDAGAFLLRRWALPPLLECIAYHHHGFTRIGPETKEWAVLNACVLISDFLCDALGLGGEADARAYDRDVAPALALLDIPQSHLDALIKGLAQACRSEHDLFD